MKDKGLVGWSREGVSVSDSGVLIVEGVVVAGAVVVFMSMAKTYSRGWRGEVKGLFKS